MNFLAHAFLSGTNPETLLGNFMGDFIKGREYEKYSSEITNGVLLHREIDYYTDHHASVEQSKIRLRPKFGHYAPVVVDIFYDHFLVQNWDRYSGEKLEEFIAKVYSIVDGYFHLIPPRLQAIFPNMKKNNWLLHYGYIEGVRRSLSGMSRRSRFNPELQRATDDLQDHYDEFDEDFNSFFPDLIKFVNQYLLSLI